jgi:hypothetical protein
MKTCTSPSRSRGPQFSACGRRLRTHARPSSAAAPVGVEDEVAMDRADTLTTSATDMLAEDFTDFLFPDAPAAGAPQA